MSEREKPPRTTRASILESGSYRWRHPGEGRPQEVFLVMDLRGLLLACLDSRMMLPPLDLIQKPVVDPVGGCLNFGRHVSRQQHPRGQV